MLIFGQANRSSPSVAFFFAGCIAVALYNSLEIIVLAFATFKRYRGCYFWCLLIASLGLIISSIGFSLYFFEITTEKFIQSAVTIAGWWMYITAQSLVLWSRLHLVLRNPTILRGVLAMIIFDAVGLLIPTTVIALGYNLQPTPVAFTNGYIVMENIQITMFFVQECIISGLYIYSTIKLLTYTSEKRKRRLISELLTINIVIVMMGCVLLALQYAGFRILQIAVKPFVYSLKLKCEFAVLSRLTNFMQQQTELHTIQLFTVIEHSRLNASTSEDTCRAGNLA